MNSLINFRISRNIVSILLCALNFISCATTGQQMSEYEEISVTLKVDNTKVDICDKFSIAFEGKNEIYTSKVKGCLVKLPVFKNGLDELIATFTYDGYKMRFDSVKTKWLLQNRKMSWDFVVKNKPFKEGDLKDIDLNKVAVIYYWQFNPLEEGDGIELIKPIMIK